MKLWYHNAKTNEIGSYNQGDGLTDFPRGEFMAYGEYITTGFVSKKEAELWAEEWGACPSCKRASTKPKYSHCGTEVK